MLIMLLLCFAGNSRGQVAYENARDRQARIFDIEDLPANEMPGSCFRYYHLADSFSKLKDSANASAAFVQVDPYYLLYLKQDPLTLDTFFTFFTLTGDARKSYSTQFFEVYSRPHSQAFDSLRRYWAEDKHLRIIRENVHEAKLDSIEARIRHDDSIHFRYLYHYVQSNGWPSMADGSLFAGTIALHDYEHYEYYFPLMKQAFLDKILDYKLIRKMHDFSGLLDGYDSVAAHLQNVNYDCFDVSCLLHKTLPYPDRVNEIEQAIKKHCLIKDVFLVYENSKVNPHNYREKNEEFFSLTKGFVSYAQKFKTQMLYLFSDMPGEICPQYTKRGFYAYDIISDRVKDKLTLYIIY